MFKRISVFLASLAILAQAAYAQTRFAIQDPEGSRTVFFTDGTDTLRTPQEGLWSIATGWEDDWMTGWVHVRPSSVETSGGWTILKGKASFPQGDLLLTDSYSLTREGLVHCVRRFEWNGSETLPKVTLSVRLQKEGTGLQLMAPGIIYYGNKNGSAINPELVAVWNGQPGEFAIFEDHRYPMPFVMLEDPSGLEAVAVHTVPSPVRGAVLQDQWWSLGAEARDGLTEIVLYSGPIGYNGTYSVAKALQRKPMRYSDTWIDLEPGRVVEKEYYIDVYGISRKGTGFQRPVYTALDLYKPYDADRFAPFGEIIEAKYRFALSRWFEGESFAGFDMYDPRSGRKRIVMGWCGQAASPGYALQVLSKDLGDPSIHDRVQRSLDFLTGCPFNPDGTFAVCYDTKSGTWSQGDPVSCGQAMYNFAKAIGYARKHRGGYDTSKWEAFLRKACDSASSRILSDGWDPVSTAEAFYIAPLAVSSGLFRNKEYAKAARKAAELFAERHLEMDGCYWGGTLDATCEDKEGAWAAFQGFLECYERFSDRRYLEWARHAMDVCLSYTVVWDIPLPPGRLSDHAFKSTGWTVVSAQNQHLDVYGVLFAPEVYKMGKILGDERLVRLSKVMFRSCSQLIDPSGSQGEQVQHTNFAQQGDMSSVYKLRGGYSENWTVFWITAHFLNAAARFRELGVRE